MRFLRAIMLHFWLNCDCHIPQTPTLLLRSVILMLKKGDRYPVMSAHQSSGVAHPQWWWNYNIPDKRAQKTGIKETGRIAPEAFTFITNLIHLPLLQSGKRGKLGNSNAAQFVRKSNASVSSITRRNDLGYQ